MVGEGPFCHIHTQVRCHPDGLDLAIDPVIKEDVLCPHWIIFFHPEGAAVAVPAALPTQEHQLRLSIMVDIVPENILHRDGSIRFPDRLIAYSDSDGPVFQGDDRGAGNGFCLPRNPRGKQITHPQQEQQNCSYCKDDDR